MTYIKKLMEYTSKVRDQQFERKESEIEYSRKHLKGYNENCLANTCRNKIGILDSKSEEKAPSLLFQAIANGNRHGIFKGLELVRLDTKDVNGKTVHNAIFELARKYYLLGDFNTAEWLICFLGKEPKDSVSEILKQSFNISGEEFNRAEEERKKSEK